MAFRYGAALSLVVLACGAEIVARSNPHSHDGVKTKRGWLPLHERREQPDEGPAAVGRNKFGQLEVEVQGLDTVNRTVYVEVKWSGIGFTRHGDHIAIYPSENDPLSSAPIKLKVLPNATEGKNKGVRPGNNGTITFQMIGRRTPYIAIYVGGEANWPEVMARSDPFSPVDNSAPLGGHIALGSRGGAPHMLIMWNSKEIDSPVVEWGTSPGALTKQVAPFRSLTYKPYDMCDPELSPAAQFGWLDPGYHHSVLLDELEYGEKYYYTFGGDGGRSKIYSFQAPHPLGENTTAVTRMYVFGDMGQAPSDGSSQHSWDFNEMGEIPARAVTKMIGGAVEDGDMVLHIGDISYAVGYLSEWDQFMHQIEPVATRVPWQTGIGNHELGYSRSFFGPPSDSGGECGVPYNTRFPFGQPGVQPISHNYRPWYSFNFGRAHVVVTSTEHNFTRGSIQHLWVEQDLANVDRTVTPWLIFTGHRPMYPDSTWKGDQQVSGMLQEAYEYLLIRHRVDLCLWGHQHVYTRSCPIRNGKCVAPGEGPVHMTIGMAGYELSTDTLMAKKPIHTVVANNTHYGAIRIEMLNSKKADIKFMNTAGEPVDSFSLTHINN